MGYFDERKNVEEYIRMAAGYDGRALIAVLGGPLCEPFHCRFAINRQPVNLQLHSAVYHVA